MAKELAGAEGLDQGVDYYEALKSIQSQLPKDKKQIDTAVKDEDEEDLM
jgi:hypothetical protein